MPAAMTALVHKTVTYIENLFRDNAGGHDAAHSLRVYRNAMKIAETEPEAGKFTAHLKRPGRFARASKL